MCVVKNQVGHQPAAPLPHLNTELGRFFGQFSERAFEPVTDLDLSAVQCPDQLGFVVARHRERMPSGGHAHRQAQHTGDGEQVWLVEFAQTPATRLGGADARDRLVDVVVALRCAEQVGRLQGAQRLTAAYARTREQFGRPIGTFQAVSQRLADGYIDTLGADLTVWSALWRLEVGLPASAEVAIAALWAADAGHRVAHTTVHVHGGVGIDLDGEAHRYFTALKRGEFDLGGVTLQARRIGALLAG